MENKQFKNPCITCITLPICIQRYRELIERGSLYPIAWISDYCDLIQQEYIKQTKQYHEISEWWRINYGE